MEPAYRITIHKELVPTGGKQEWRWIASRPECLLATDEAKWRIGPQRSEIVEWELKAPGTAAHIQFTDMELFENERGSSRLTRDMTAEVMPGQPLRLKMKGHMPADHAPRRHYYYAIWVREGAEGSFAVGDTLNPPPDVTLGP